jgi:hypothetical protein
MTPRNRSLFLERGHAYVYLVYGSAYMLNVSSEIAGIGAGVLIRALEPRDGIQIMQRNRQIELLRDLARDQEDSPRHCGLILGSMGSIFAEKALYGSDAVITNPAKSGRASGSESRGMRTGSCDFIFGAVRSSAVQDCLLLSLNVADISTRDAEKPRDMPGLRLFRAFSLRLESLWGLN